jgi:hypothetical protein
MSQPEDRPRRVVSEKKRAANRANARKSTGPRTARGKLRVSLNALTHGLTAATAVLPFENRDHFEKFAAALRADLEPKGFLQALMVERLIELAWKLRRAAKAQLLHAGKRLGEQVHTLDLARKAGAWTGPDLDITGTDVLLDSAEGEEKEAAAYLRLDLYADRCQRAFQLGLSALRREQRRREERVGPDVEEELDHAREQVEVELGLDREENAYFMRKATGGNGDDGEPEDLTQYIAMPTAQAMREVAGLDENGNWKNKATAGGNGAQPRGSENGNGSAGKVDREETPVQPPPGYDAGGDAGAVEPEDRSTPGGSVPADDAAGRRPAGVGGGGGDAGAAHRPAHDGPGPAAVPDVGVPKPADVDVDCAVIGLRGWRPGNAPGGIFRSPAPPAPGPVPGT